MNKNNNRLTIQYADDHIVVVEKPGGLLAVPGRGPDKQDCIVGRLRKQFPECINQPAVHRLDMATSGLMVLALTQKAHRNISIQFEKRQVEKTYIAKLENIIEESSGEIALAFRLDPDNRPYQVYDPVQGKLGITRWRRLAIEQGQTRIEFKPLTGRTHQLRTHAAHLLGLNAPIIGDKLYGKGNEGESLHLHASFLAFQHPATNQVIDFHSPAPF